MSLDTTLITPVNLEEWIKLPRFMSHLHKGYVTTESYKCLIEYNQQLLETQCYFSYYTDDYNNKKLISQDYINYIIYDNKLYCIKKSGMSLSTNMYNHIEAMHENACNQAYEYIIEEVPLFKL